MVVAVVTAVSAFDVGTPREAGGVQVAGEGDFRLVRPHDAVQIHLFFSWLLSIPGTAL
jgi:hypothetical protein